MATDEEKTNMDYLALVKEVSRVWQEFGLNASYSNSGISKDKLEKGLAKLATEN